MKRLIPLLILPFLLACSQTDELSPAVRTDLLCATTNAEGLVERLVLDNDQSLRIDGQSINANAKSATLRCLCTYAVNADSTVATVYSISKTSCYAPIPADSFDTRPMDPVNVVSVYKTGRFINLHLSMLTTGMTGTQYDLCLDSLTSDSTILHCSFLFKRVAADNESYTKHFYHSIPLNLANYSHPFDSIFISVNTYDGMKQYKFER